MSHSTSLKARLLERSRRAREQGDLMEAMDLELAALAVGMMSSHEVSSLPPAVQFEGPPPPEDAIQGCPCEYCLPLSIQNMRMIVCSICGNKRCPHATHHNNACTNSNEPGQKGSSWEKHPVFGKS